MAQDPYKYFRLEGRELLDQFAKDVLELEKGGSSAALVQRLLRLAHTLKGAARIVKQQAIADHAHAIEDALAPCRDSGAKVGAERINEVLRHLDDINGHFLTLGLGDSAPVACSHASAALRCMKSCPLSSPEPRAYTRSSS